MWLFFGGYDMYSFKYKWDDQELVGFCEYFSRLYDKSISTYFANNPEIDTAEITAINKAFEYLEDFLKYLLDNDYFDDKLDFIRGVVNLKLIYVLPSLYRDRFNGLTLDQIVYFNPNMIPFENLSSSDTFRLAVNHEMSHIFSDTNDFFFEAFKKNIFNDYTILNTYSDKIDDCSFDDFTAGFDFLDEALSQDIAENALCSYNGTSRRKQRYGRNPTLYPEGVFKFNFYQYQEFQEMANKFIHFLGYGEDVEDALDYFSKRYFDKNFIINAYYSFLDDSSRIVDFCTMLVCMGKVKKAIYENRGEDVSTYINLFNEIYQNNVQYGGGGYQKVKE